MPRDPKQAASEKLTPQELWNEIVLTRSGIDQLLQQGEETGNLQPVQEAIEELKLKTANYEQLLEEMQAPLKAVLGKNFLGTAEWQKGFGVNVGAPPPIPEHISPEFLDSNCPLHPGLLIKNTHILMLIPKTVNGQPYSALKLAELCEKQKGSGNALIYTREIEANEWKAQPWASTSLSASEWVLIPKSDASPGMVLGAPHFLSKNIAAQAEVYRHYEAEYREAKSLELMTAALLNDVVNGERIWSRYLHRTAEQSPSGGRVLVGHFNVHGLGIHVDDDGSGSFIIGGALARKSRS
jgi:hypothetical protein